MKEDFLHYCWKFQYFNHLPLQTTNGEEISVLKAGIHNYNAGPDFLEAKIKIGETVWAGNVEIHTHSSQWYAHKHDKDNAYKNVILHVVYEHDKEVKLPSGEKIPVLQLKDYIDENWIKKYENFIQAKLWIPCANQLKNVPDIIKSQCIEKVLIERLEQKTILVLEELKIHKNDWSETFHVRLANNFGFKVNNQPFEILAKSLPLKILSKHRNDIFQIEALLFGQAGMLDENFKDDYPQKLKKEYQFLQKKYDLVPIEKHQWRFARMRPVNFPTLRITQFAQLIFQSKGLFSKIISTEKAKQIQQLFANIEASDYWQTHYTFDKKSTKRPKRLGKSAINNIIINTVAPIIFSYGQFTKSQKNKEMALDLLSETPPENNNIIKKWEGHTILAKNAFETQALIQLKNNYCDNKECLNCTIGHYLLKPIIK